MNMQMTVIQLKRELEKAVANGYGDHLIALSNDNEGNGYHGMFLGITTDNIEYYVDEIYDSNHKPDGSDVVILG